MWCSSGVFLDGGAGGLAGTDGPEGIISGEKSFRLIFTDCVSCFQKALICRLQWPSHILSMVSHPVQWFLKYFSSCFALFYSVKYVHIPLHTHTHSMHSLCSCCTFRTLSVFDLGDGETAHSCFDVLHNGTQLPPSPRSPRHCVSRYHISSPGIPSHNRNHLRGQEKKNPTCFSCTQGK